MKKRVWDVLILVQNVIDVKERMTFKVLLVKRWSLGSELGSHIGTKRK